MNTIKPELKKIATISIVLVLIIYAVTHYIFKTPPEFIIFKIGIIITGIGLFWFYFDIKGWRQSAFRLFGWLCNTPNLNGRYEGIISRHDEDNPHKFVMEIKQTYRDISINTYTQNSLGK